jgi:hypothetical protein
MSASTSTNKASPPTRSIVSGEDTSSRVTLGRARRTATLAVFALLTLGFAFTRLCTRVSRRTAAAGAGAGGGVNTGGGGDTTTGCGARAGGGGGGGGETRAAGGGGGAGGGVAPGTGSGLGDCVVGGAGSGSGPAAGAGAARTVAAPHTTRTTDACRSNDRAESLIPALPSLVLPTVLVHSAQRVNGAAGGSGAAWPGADGRRRPSTQAALPSPVQTTCRRSSSGCLSFDTAIPRVVVDDLEWVLAPDSAANRPQHLRGNPEQLSRTFSRSIARPLRDDTEATPI